MINFKIYDVTNCTVINYSTYTAQSGNEIWQVNEIIIENVVVVEKLDSQPFIKNQNNR